VASDQGGLMPDELSTGINGLRRSNRSPHRL